MRQLLFLTTIVLLGALCACRVSQAELETRAEAGDAQALRTIALQSFSGELGKVDYNAARRHFAAAAAHDDPVAFYYLGLLAEKGLGKDAPDATSARRNYEKAWKLSEAVPRADRSAQEEFVRGEMLFFGRGVDEDRAAGINEYKNAMRRLCVPAMIRLGVLYETGTKGLAPYPERGRYLLEKAAKSGYPEAKYLLSEQLASINPDHAAILLREAADAGFPDAVLKNCRRTNTPIPLEQLIAQGSPEALYRGSLATAQGREALTAAAARGHLGALRDLRSFYNAANDPARGRIISETAAAHDLALGNPGPETPTTDYFAMEFPVAALWNRTRPLDRIVALDSPLEYYANGQRAGIANSRENWRKALAQNVDGAYFGCDWRNIYRSGLPMGWAGDIFRARLAAGGAPDAAFLLHYAIAAGLAGQGAPQCAAADQLLSIGGFPALALLLKANALVLLGREAEAYELLQSRYRDADGGRQPEKIACFLNAWCPGLLQNREKLAAVTGLPLDTLASDVKPPRKQTFYDLVSKQDLEFVAEPELAPEK